MEFTASRLKSHQTTIRFTSELWSRLQAAAASLDVSVAQYVRDAARGRLEAETAHREPETRADALGEELYTAKEASREHMLGATAVWEQGRLARIRAAQLREEAQRLRRRALETRAPSASLRDESGVS
jgi:predicted DNA-binding protein